MTDPAKTVHPIVAPKKLIEVALPLDEINKASAREKSIRHGHPSTLHMWWARRPLAAARAVLFAQLVNDPSWKYSEEELKKPQIKSAITRKRNELFKLITQLVQWENTNNEEVLNQARVAIRESWRETCEANKKHPEAKTLFNPDKLPPFHDPFAGGGSIPLEAQRLGLEAHASDLNPVAVLINKAMIEIPPKFAGRPPVGPLPQGEKQTNSKATENWTETKGIAEDVRRYGTWIQEEAWKRIGHLYPPVKITEDVVKRRPDLKKYVGRELTAIAWLWARTTVSPNPAIKGKHVPLLSTWFLSKRPKKEAWIRPVISASDYELRIQTAASGSSPVEISDEGTKMGRGANFKCLLSSSPITPDYLRKEGSAGRLGLRMLAIVCEGDGERVFVEALASTLSISNITKPTLSTIALPMPHNPRWFSPPDYGMRNYDDLFTNRQAVMLSMFSSLINEIRSIVKNDAVATFGNESLGLMQGGCGAIAYADAISLFMAFSLSKILDTNNALSQWSPLPSKLHIGNLFGRQAIPMFWNFGEANPFANSSGSWMKCLSSLPVAISQLPAYGTGYAEQQDAALLDVKYSPIVSTDPPYYDNVDYSDLSDFFYLWLRRSLSNVAPLLFGTIATPKSEEIIVAIHRHESESIAEEFFRTRMALVMDNLNRIMFPAYPLTLYYAFKQSESSNDLGTVSTGWERFLEALLQTGFSVTGTWPARTERTTGLKEDVNALASSIVLVCRRRPDNAITIDRREFLRELETVLPLSLSDMISAETPEAAVAPVDLAQASIGPGMAIFSKYKAVLEADGSPMSVHSALSHINKAIDDYFAHAEGDMDADTRFCIDWFQQHEFEEGPFGTADVLARAKGTAVDGVRDAGVVQAGKGKVRLLRVKEYSASWDPTKDSRLPIWEACHQMCRALGESESEAGSLLARMSDKQDAIRQLAYRLYTICERKGWAEDARAYNELVTSWPAIVEESLKTGHKGSQMNLL